VDADYTAAAPNKPVPRLRAKRSHGWLAGPLVFAAVVLLRALGAFVPAELAVYDALLQLRPSPELGPGRVTMIAVGEPEFERFGYPLSNDAIALSLARLSEMSPRSIGIDIYRADPPAGDSEAVADWEALGRAVRADPNTVMIQKLRESRTPGFPAPSFIEDPRQIGFNDLVYDPLSVVRRGYLIDWDEQGQSAISLALQLATSYMAEDGIAMGPDSEDEALIALGDCTIPPLEPNDGGYRGVDANGYQFLLDYARGLGGIPVYSLSALVDGELTREDIADREGRLLHPNREGVSRKGHGDTRPRARSAPAVRLWRESPGSLPQ
jgi:adenylate cyclase